MANLLLREVKTCIALLKRDYSGWLFQLVYMYILPNLIAVLGPLAICMLIQPLCLTRRVPFKDMRHSNIAKLISIYLINY